MGGPSGPFGRPGGGPPGMGGPSGPFGPGRCATDPTNQNRAPPACACTAVVPLTFADCFSSLRVLPSARRSPLIPTLCPLSLPWPRHRLPGAPPGMGMGMGMGGPGGGGHPGGPQGMGGPHMSSRGNDYCQHFVDTGDRCGKALGGMPPSREWRPLECDVTHDISSRRCLARRPPLALAARQPRPAYSRNSAPASALVQTPEQHH